MIYIHIFLAFFIPGIVGYGGGPASIPLIEHEVVSRYGWMTTSEFSEVLALGNALPGPIATKMAGYIGFEIGGVFGAVVAILSTVAPSLFLMIVLLMGTLALEFFQTSFSVNGLWETLFIAVICFFLLEKWKVHPAFVIVGGLAFGALFLS